MAWLDDVCSCLACITTGLLVHITSFESSEHAVLKLIGISSDSEFDI